MGSYKKMKDEEFQKKLELILETFYDIDREVKKYLDKEKFYIRHYDKINFPNDMPVLDDQYKREGYGR